MRVFNQAEAFMRERLRILNDCLLYILRPTRMQSSVACPRDGVCEENDKKLGGTVGWGLVSGALLGPVGLLAGLFMGGRAKNAVFTVRLCLDFID
jgi:hypothetical protein